MPIINDGEILARVHKFKLFRKEGNLCIDLYEALVGKSASKFIAVPNLIIQEADKNYFGFGDSKKEALKDCLKKIKDIPIHTIVQLDNGSAKNKNSDSNVELMQKIKHPSGTSIKKQAMITSHPSAKIKGVITDTTRPDGFMDDIIGSRGKSKRGKPIKNAKIFAVCKGVGKRKTRTNSSGYYEFTDLEDGVWTLTIKAKGYEVQEAKVKIIGGGEYEENFE